MVLLLLEKHKRKIDQSCLCPSQGRAAVGHVVQRLVWTPRLAAPLSDRPRRRGETDHRHVRAGRHLQPGLPPRQTAATVSDVTVPSAGAGGDH